MAAFITLTLNLGEVANDLAGVKPGCAIAVAQIAAVLPRYTVKGEKLPGSRILVTGGTESCLVWEEADHIMHAVYHAVDNDRRDAAKY